ncbi:3-phosphoserine/phosphohydroxythreonine transaminase [Halomonas sp. HP20-15]|uniref:3-phosphoserine/phosphohydroxythreonine transaminase n=1 Tax=Halomonas sp. HP20-15 TaxID=3085901 RepID=UPI002981E464|nr:3-phosphoserine/phosphohydroxythreonine transaminase [Halomonas sp. HP20-15]MDW5376749.1 3-phosphoserine/phosphohydroxythreonine transaminase [Halomonas sp. HP20-15]
MTRRYNFCAGPAALPTPVLERAREEMLDYRGHGLSVMEMSHRSPEFEAIAGAAEANLRTLLQIPDNYRVLFMQGGATMQFACVPLNLLGGGGTPNYLDTGIWSGKAIKEADHLAGSHLAATSRASGYVDVPRNDAIALSADAAYLHYCHNETIGGLAYDYTPDVAVPLVCDMSSSILSTPLDVSRYGVIYAGAQKNIGPAGLTLVIVRDDLLGQALPRTPSLLDWKVYADNASMINTPPTYAWYLAGLVFEWLRDDVGGIEAMATINRRKAATLYGAIDASDFYSNPIAPVNRSLMNVPFVLADEALNNTFLDEAEAAGLLNLKGHRSVGGMRASLYNAVTEQAVDALVAFMGDFERRHG